MTSATSAFCRAAVGADRFAARDRDRRGPSWGIWAFGLLCGLGIATLGEAAMVPLPSALAVVSALLLGAAALRRALLARHRVLVWEEPAWSRQR